MNRTLNKILASLPEERRQHIEVLAGTLLEEESLRSKKQMLRGSELLGRLFEDNRNNQDMSRFRTNTARGNMQRNRFR